MIIKVLLIAGIAGAGLFASRIPGAGTGLALRRLLGAGLVIVAAVSVAFPEITNWAANLVGVGQGSNLVLYGLVVAFLFAVTALYQRISHLEGQLTQLTRAIAILSADKAEPRTELREPVQ